MSARWIAPLLLATALLAGAPAAFAARQPQMMRALHSLQRARMDLQRAAPNKGGWRARAIEQVDAAIASVRAGIRYANAR